MTEIKRYETKPLDSWKRAKELRLNLYRDIAQVKEKGKILFSGGTEGLIALTAGFSSEYFGGEPYGASVGTDPLFSQQCSEAVEAKGYARDFCAYARNYIGSMFLNRYAFGGKFPEVDICLQTHICDTHAKWYQIVSEYRKIPYFAIDVIPYHWEESTQGKRLKLEYVVSQMHDAIGWMEKTLGKRYDDERFIEAVHNECLSTSLWAEICALNKSIPAPLDEKSMFSLYIIAVLMRHKKEAVEFYQMLKDEVKDRVERQIAAVATERCRLLHDSQPPWYGLRIFRYLEKYGVVTIGSHYSFGLSGGWTEREDGSWGEAKPPTKEDIKNRDGAIRTLAGWLLSYHTLARSLRIGGEGKNSLILRLVREWQTDGVMIHLNRGCEGIALSQMEVRLSLLSHGIPVMTYEGNVADSREFDESRTLARIDAFMESLGLKRIED